MSDFTRRIYNYELQAEGKQVIMIPRNAEIIGVVEKYGFPFLLAVIDENAVVEPRTFQIVTTGQVFNYAVLKYVGTLRLGGEESNGAWYTAHVLEIETVLNLPEHRAEVIDPRNDKYRGDLATLRTELEGKRRVERDASVSSWPEED
jgi:hypothetical protein